MGWKGVSESWLQGASYKVCKLQGVQVRSYKVQVTGIDRVQGDIASYRVQGAGKHIIHPKSLFCIFIEIFNHEKLP